MRYAVYLRKSTQDERKTSRGDPSIPVENQRANGQRFIEARGGVLEDDFVFSDDARSGADFERAGLKAMMARKDEINVLVVADRSRLGRHRARTASIIDELIEAGVEIWSYEPSIGLIAGPETSDEQFLMGQVHNYGSTRARKDAKIKARQGLVDALRKGHHVGGTCYGYKLKQVLSEDGSVRLHTVQVIDPDQARVARQIFEAHAAGHGFTAIAKTLNGDPKYSDLNRQFFGGDTPPCPGHLINPGKYPNPHSWCPTALREMLYRERYAGRIRFGAMENHEKGGRVHLRRKQKDKAKIIVVDAPELRIIPESLWAATRHRLKAVRENYVRQTDGRMWLGRVESGIHSKYFLSGVMRCRGCGGSMIATASKRNGKMSSCYACSRNNKRGSTACTNNMRPLMHEVDGLVLQEIRDKILTPERIERAVRAGAQKAAERRQREPQEEDRLRAELASLQAEIQRFLDLIGAGHAPATVLARIESLERQVTAKQTLLTELQAASVTDLGEFRLHKQLRENLERFRELVSSRNMPKARQAIRRLLGTEVLWFSALPEGGYELTATTRLGPLFDGCEVIGAGGGT